MGIKTALLVIDVQNALVSAVPYSLNEVLTNIKKLVDVCRKNDVEVIYVKHNGKPGGELEPNTEGWEIHGMFDPQNGEKVITKNFNSIFKETDVREYLQKRGIRRLIITGMQTEYCIDTTCKVAFEYGFELIIPEKTNTTFDNGNIAAKDIYEHYNFNVLANRFGIVEKVADTLKRIGK